jgi:serine/threonine protein kinase
VEHFEDDKFIYIVMELCPGGDLTKLLFEHGNSLAEGDARAVFWQVLVTIQHLHHRNITHRDLKPENILIEHAKGSYITHVADFGFAKACRGHDR